MKLIYPYITYGTIIYLHLSCIHSLWKSTILKIFCSSCLYQLMQSLLMQYFGFFLCYSQLSTFYEFLDLDNSPTLTHRYPTTYTCHIYNTAIFSSTYYLSSVHQLLFDGVFQLPSYFYGLIRHSFSFVMAYILVTFCWF